MSEVEIVGVILGFLPLLIEASRSGSILSMPGCFFWSFINVGPFVERGIKAAGLKFFIRTGGS